MAKKKKYYVVWHGNPHGVFDSWDTCKKAIEGVSGAKYRSFPTREEAEGAYHNKEYTDFAKKNPKKPRPINELKLLEEIDLCSVAVDAASSGNPGKMEYRGVNTQTGRELFRQGPFEQGTNNIGEFLAIVHALALLKQKNSRRSIYTDSRIAMGWVKRERCNTKLRQTHKNRALFELIRRAEAWLQNNRYNTKIVKWKTKKWGEIPADFGRK